MPCSYKAVGAISTWLLSCFSCQETPAGDGEMPQKNLFREVIHQQNSLSFRECCEEGEFSVCRTPCLLPSLKAPLTDLVTFFGHHLLDYILHGFQATCLPSSPERLWGGDLIGTHSKLAGAEPVWTSIQLFDEMYGPVFCASKANRVKGRVPNHQGLTIKPGNQHPWPGGAFLRWR